MISLIQSIVSPQASLVSTKSASFASLVTQGNLIVIVGAYNLISGSVITISDSLVNKYTINQAVSDTLGGSYWFAYAVSQSTGTSTVTVTYSVQVTSSSFTVMEFSNSIDWVSPPASDGSSFLTGNGVDLSSHPLITLNADDLVIAMSTCTTGSTVTIGSSWSFVVQQSSVRSVWWKGLTTVGLIPAFMATQTVSGTWSVVTWAIQANLFSPSLVNIITSSVNPTAFIEVYPSRIKEDIYDSLEGQPQFIYVQYGPSLLNG